MTEDNYLPNQKLITEIASKFKEALSFFPEVKIATFDWLYADLLDDNEADEINKILRLNPAEYGFKGPYYGIEERTAEVVQVPTRKYLDGKNEIFVSEYLPNHVLAAYSELNIAMKEKIDRDVLIVSGFRSHAYQLLLFVKFLALYNFDLNKTAARVALPGYSQHCLADQTAVDFLTIDGVPDLELTKDFSKTPEFSWLKTNANRFGFFMSYPRDNEFGVMHEPWHWQFRGLS